MIFIFLNLDNSFLYLVEFSVVLLKNFLLERIIFLYFLYFLVKLVRSFLNEGLCFLFMFVCIWNDLEVLVFNVVINLWCVFVIFLVLGYIMFCFFNREEFLFKIDWIVVEFVLWFFMWRCNFIKFIFYWLYC